VEGLKLSLKIQFLQKCARVSPAEFAELTVTIDVFKYWLLKYSSYNLLE